jgi:hypothetical protein
MPLSVMPARSIAKLMSRGLASTLDTVHRIPHAVDQLFVGNHAAAPSLRTVRLVADTARSR